MSAAKMVILQPDAWIVTVSAVLGAQRDLRRSLGHLPQAPEFVDYLRGQIAVNTDALNALNATEVTVTAVMGSNAARGALADLDEGMQRLVITAMYDMRVDRVKHLRNMVDGKRKYDEGVPCAMGICQADVESARTALEKVDAALLFLENPK